MPHFVDNHANHPVFGAFGIGAVLFRATVIEADHRVFHPDFFGVHRNRGGIRIIKSVFGIISQRVCHNFCGILLPERIAFFGIVGHRHHRAIAERHAHRVPNKFSGACPTEIANVFRFENPGFAAIRFIFFILAGFGFGNDHHRFAGAARFAETLLLLRRKHLSRILQHASRSDNVIRRNGDAHRKIAETQCEFAAAQKLFVLPAIHLVIHGHSRIKLGDGVEVIVVFRKIFVAGAAAHFHAIVDVIPPFYVERKRAARL